MNGIDRNLAANLGLAEPGRADTAVDPWSSKTVQQLARNVVGLAKKQVDGEILRYRDSVAKLGVESFEKLGTALRDLVERECNKKFVETIKYLPSGADYRRALVEDMTREVTRLLEYHQQRIESDVVFLRDSLTKLDVFEERLRMLENHGVVKE